MLNKMFSSKAYPFRQNLIDKQPKNFIFWVIPETL